MEKYKLVIADDGTGMYCGDPCKLCEVRDICHSDLSNGLEDTKLFDLIMECREDDGLDICIVIDTEDENIR